MTGEAVRPVPLVPQRRFDGVRFGSRRSARRGQGDEVAGMRPYRRGDRTSWIDWRASGRLSAARGADEFVTREFFAEQAPRVALVCDRRPGMGVHGADLPWLQKPLAVDAVTALIAASAIGERGELAYADHTSAGPTWLRPSPSGHRAALRRRLAGAYDGPVDSLGLSLRLLLRHRTQFPTGSFIFVVSDFLGPVPAAEWARLRRLAWDVTPVVVQDPTWEQSFPHVRGVLLPVADPESGDLLDAWVQRGDRRAERNEARLAATLDGFRRLGFDPVVIGSDHPAEVRGAFGRWAERRRRVRRAA